MEALPKADLLKRAIKLQKAISDRTENQKLEDHTRLFVKNPRDGLMSALAGNANQILFGRRGTGKTMLLRNILCDGRPYNPSSDYIAIMIQTPDFLRSPETFMKDSSTHRARVYFREFLHQVADQIIDIGDEILKDENLLTRLGIKNRAKREILSDRILTLYNVLKYGVPIYRYDTATFNEHFENFGQNKETDEHETEAGIKNNAEINIKGVHGEVGAKMGTSLHKISEQAQKQTVLDKEDFSADFDFGIPEIRSKFKDILEMLESHHVVILLDEWQAINFDCQFEFAELLKRCFFGIDCISFKIAAYRHVCQFNNGATRHNFRGLELGQDIADAGDTDLPAAENYTKEFFFNMLYRRLLFKEPLLESFYGPPDKFDYKYLMSDIFHNEHAADMLVRGCHGISRDFIKTFNIAAGYMGDDVARSKITLEHVNRAHGESSKEIQGNVHAADDVGGLLFEIVKPHVHRTGAPYFFLSQLNHQWDSLLSELVEKRALHVIPSSNMPNGADVEWRGFEVAYGLFHEWRRAEMFAAKTNSSHMQWSEVRQLKQQNFKDYVLELAEEPSSLRVCANCSKQFPTSSHSYVIARLCPHCYAKQDE